MTRNSRIKWLRVLLAAPLCLVFIGGLAYLNFVQVPPSSVPQTPAATATTGIFPRESYYEEFLPYISADALPLPLVLPNLTIDPTSYTPLRASGFHNDYIPPEARLYMVQYKTSKDTNYSMDTRPVRKFNQNVFIVQVNAEELKSLMQNPDVNFIEQYHPHYKIHPNLVRAWYENTIAPHDTIALTVSPFVLAEEIEHFLSETSGQPVEAPSYVLEDSSTYMVSGFTDKSLLFTYALHPWIHELNLVSESL